MQWKTFLLGAGAGALVLLLAAGAIVGFFPDLAGRALGDAEDAAGEIGAIRERIEALTAEYRDQIDRYERALGDALTEAGRGQRITAGLATELREAREQAQLLGEGIAGLQDDNVAATEPIEGIENVARRLGEIAEALETQDVD